jgi:hypothetical protein
MPIKYWTYKACQSLMGPKFSDYESKLKSQPGALEFRFIFHVDLSLLPSKPFSAMQRNISLVHTKQTKQKNVAILLNVSGFRNSFSLRSEVRKVHISTRMTAVFA